MEKFLFFIIIFIYILCYIVINMTEFESIVFALL